MTQDEIIGFYTRTPQQEYDALPDGIRAYATRPTSDLSINQNKSEWSREDMIMRGLQSDKPENWANI